MTLSRSSMRRTQFRSPGQTQANQHLALETGSVEHQQKSGSTPTSTLPEVRSRLSEAHFAAKPLRCAHCKVTFTPVMAGQKVHLDCAWPFVQAQNAKKRAAAVAKDKTETRAKLAALDPISKIEKQCRDIVQEIARIRDRNDGCISCELPANWDGQWHGSHFRSHGACSALQFHLWNIHKSCWICNKLYSGRIDAYRPRLVAKIGADRVDWLDCQNAITRPGREYLERFKKVMGKRLRRMRKKHG